MLDALRKKRNLSDYMAVDIDPAIVKDCVAEAEALLQDLISWLKRYKPELLSGFVTPRRA